MSKDKNYFFHNLLQKARSWFVQERVFVKTKGEVMNRDVDVLARTIFGEARGECSDGKKAVGLVILNRYKSNKWFSASSIAEVCLKPLQFSCWNSNDPNSSRIRNANEKELSAYFTLAEDLIKGKFADITNGATHYHTKAVKPAWSRGKAPCAEIGEHLFFNNIG